MMTDTAGKGGGVLTSSVLTSAHLFPTAAAYAPTTHPLTFVIIF